MEPSKELEKAMESKFLTPTKFSMEIEKIVAEEKLNYIEAICQYCKSEKECSRNIACNLQCISSDFFIIKVV